MPERWQDLVGRQANPVSSQFLCKRLIPTLSMASWVADMRMCALQVSVTAHHLLCWAVSQEEAVLPQSVQHCIIWSARHLRVLCRHRLCALPLLTASNHPQAQRKPDLDACCAPQDMLSPLQVS